MPSKKQTALCAVEKLKEQYPTAVCSLQATEPFQLLIAVRLSAQCTDKRVNLVTPALFARFSTIDAFADADPQEVEPFIHSCGLSKTKAHDIVNMCRALRERYASTVPDTLEALTTLPGVGRKTANLICGDVYGKPAVVADTHCIRIANRLGLCKTKDPRKVEDALRAVLPPEESNAFCHRIVMFGRDVCTARSPRCHECPLAEFCPRKL